MPSGRIIWNGNPGEVYTNQTERFKYQLLCDLVRTCGTCLQYHLAISNWWPIPFHRNCCLPGTKIIAPDATAGYEVRYDGPIVRLTFADGSTVAVTPNHMLLTPTGFARAASLVDGDDVIRCPVADGIEVIAPDHDQRPAPIEDIVRALTVHRGMSPVRVPLHAEDFHGDGAFCEGQVDVVAADGLLGDRIEAAGFEQADEVPFIGIGLGASQLAGQCDLRSILFALRDATDGGVGILRDAKSILWGQLRHPASIRNGLIPDRHPLLDEGLTHHWARHAESRRQGILALACDVFGGREGGVESRGSVTKSLGFRIGSNRGPGLLDSPLDCAERDAKAIRNVADRFPGQVATHKIVRIEIQAKHYRGSVFDVETTTSLYQFANGIVSSNCRCSQVPIRPGQTSRPFESFRAILDGLDPAQITEAIGASNYKLLRAGVVGWDDIVTETRVRSLKEVVAARKLPESAMLKAGVPPRFAREAYQAVHTPEQVLIRQERKLLVEKLESAGFSKEQIVKSVAKEIHAGIGIAAGPSEVSPIPSPQGGKLPDGLKTAFDKFATAKTPAPVPAKPEPFKAPKSRAERLKIDAAWRASLADAEKGAVRNYAGYGHVPINDYLRTGDVPEMWNPAWNTRAALDERVVQLDAALAKAKLDRPMTLYRGIKDLSSLGLDPANLVGATITDPAYLSTSLSKGAARGFLDDGGAILQIAAPAGSPGGYLGDLTNLEHEQEVLFARGMTLRVTGTAHEKGTLIIKAELIDGRKK